MEVDTPPQEREKSATIQPLEIPSASDDTLVVIPNASSSSKGDALNVSSEQLLSSNNTDSALATELRKMRDAEENDSNARSPRSPKALAQSSVKVGTEFIRSTKVVLFSTKICILLVFVPIALALGHAKGGNKISSGPVFFVSILAIVPLAERLGFVTEEVAAHTNETLGGLLN